MQVFVTPRNDTFLPFTLHYLTVAFPDWLFGASSWTKNPSSSSISLPGNCSMFIIKMIITVIIAMILIITTTITTIYIMMYSFITGKYNILCKILADDNHYFPQFLIKTFPVWIEHNLPIISDWAYQWKMCFNMDPNK